MTINNKKMDMNEFTAKVVESVNEGLRKMVEAAAGNDENLIIGDKRGQQQIHPRQRAFKNPL